MRSFWHPGSQEWTIFTHFRAVFVIFQKIGRFGENGKKMGKMGKKKILFLPTYSQHIYLTTLKVSARSENFFKCAKTVRFFADTTICVVCGSAPHCLLSISLTPVQFQLTILISKHNKVSLLVYHWISEFVKLKFVVTFYENVHMDIKKTEISTYIVKKKFINYSHY